MKKAFIFLLMLWIASCTQQAGYPGNSTSNTGHRQDSTCIVHVEPEHISLPIEVRWGMIEHPVFFKPVNDSCAIGTDPFGIEFNLQSVYMDSAGTQKHMPAKLPVEMNKEYFLLLKLPATHECYYPDSSHTVRIYKLLDLIEASSPARETKLKEWKR
jgi:hypothetical protein